ncbi:MAG: hypothetical protein LC722_07665 [Actinobacteria bacterium]|nr:hypothetical protein [Actinomycetota bacterium]
MRLRLLALLVLMLLAVACGDGEPANPGQTNATQQGGGEIDCSGDALEFAETGLPEDFPEVEEAVYTDTREDGPTTVVEGYFEADLQTAYDEYRAALEGADYGILFDEIEERDSEISWQTPDESRTGQVALRVACFQADRIYVRVTNRPG